MSKFFVQSMALMLASLIAAGAANAQTATAPATAKDGASLAQKNGCFNCHDIDKNKVGPPLKEAAAKYKGKSNAEFVAAVKKAHANLKASDEDLQTMHEWMQSGFMRAAGM
ncbi:MAG TPA: c-type cytochrome [Casimicrobiaceae bacterium]|nr:c-type cytochrome [Casimicrobiaceae bacterium]